MVQNNILSLFKNRPLTSFTSWENTPLKPWKSNSLQTIRRSCHENWIHARESVLKTINGAFYAVYWESRRWKEQLQPWITQKGNDGRILRRELAFYEMKAPKLWIKRKPVAWMSHLKTWKGIILVGKLKHHCVCNFHDRSFLSTVMKMFSWCYIFISLSWCAFFTKM